MAADAPDAYGVEFLDYRHRYGEDASSRSLAHLKRWINETKWKKNKERADVKAAHKKYRFNRKAGLGPSQHKQAARLEILPVEDGSLSYWPVPPLDKER
jgi:hypothetical protein